MTTARSAVWGWLFMACVCGVWVATAAVGEWWLVASVGLLWVAIFALGAKVHQLERAITRQTEELAAHVAEREVRLRRLQRVDPWLAASRGQH